MAPGETVAIVGENGAGKCTLMRICAGLVRPSSGSVETRGRVGYCPQTPGLFGLLNAEEHLRLFAPALGASESEVLRQGRALLAQLGFPLGDRSPVRSLSGGAQQKLNLALALIGDPGLLLLDEPYQGFDRDAYVSLGARSSVAPRVGGSTCWRAQGASGFRRWHRRPEVMPS